MEPRERLGKALRRLISVFQRNVRDGSIGFNNFPSCQRQPAVTDIGVGSDSRQEAESPMKLITRSVHMLRHVFIVDLFQQMLLHVGDCLLHCRDPLHTFPSCRDILYRFGDIFAFGTEDGIKDLACKIAEEKGFIAAKGPVSLEIALPDDAETEVKIPNSAYILKTRIIENTRELEYNNHSWFCPIEVLDGGEITAGNPGGINGPLRMKKAGSSGSKELKRLMTDLKIPESARQNILFIQKDGDILWLPGFGHGIGFTNAISREKYMADGKSGAFVRIAIERQ